MTEGASRGRWFGLVGLTLGVTLIIATHDESAVTRASARATVRSVQLKAGELVT